MDVDVNSHPQPATCALAPATPPADIAPLVVAVGLAAGLAACGGGGGSAPASSPAATPPTAAEASRFLAQASMGASRAQIARVQALGYAGWLDEQFALPASGTRWDWLVANGYSDISHKNDEAGFDSAAWSKLLSCPRHAAPAHHARAVGDLRDGDRWPDRRRLEAVRRRRLPRLCSKPTRSATTARCCSKSR